MDTTLKRFLKTTLILSKKQTNSLDFEDNLHKTTAKLRKGEKDHQNTLIG
jgi:hypothetical protein